MADNERVIDVEPARFEEMVGTALDSLPENLGRLMRNVAVTVEHDPGPPGLLGLYQGIPLTSRTTQYAGVLPDRFAIYRPAIGAICRTEAEVVEQVRRTVCTRWRTTSALRRPAHRAGWSIRPLRARWPRRGAPP